MDFTLSEDQKMLVEAVENFVKRESPVARLRKVRTEALGWERSVWAQMGQLGWLGVPFPEALGGLGGSFTDAALMVEVLGTALVPEPYIPSVLVAGLTVLRGGSEAQQRELLGPMLEGKTSLALASSEQESRTDVRRIATTARQTAGGYELTGRKTWVLNGQAAEHLLVSGRTSGSAGDADGLSLFVVPRDTPGLKVRTVACMDSHKAAMVELEGVTVAKEQLLGAAGAAADLLGYAEDVGAAAVCAEGAGIMRTVLQMTRDYLCEREQFGVKIGTFQALQHRLVDMFVETELAKGTAIMAMLAVDAASVADRQRAVSAAKHQLIKGGYYVTRQAIQLHGGIGVTDEHDVGLYFKRMHTLAAVYGDAEHHTERFMQLPSFTAAV